MEIEFWVREGRNSPAGKFLSKLDPYIVAKLTGRMVKLEGNSLSVLLNSGYLRHLEGRLYVIKIRLMNNFFRFPCVIEGEIIWILDGFKKKTNKLPKKDLDRARKHLGEFKSISE